MRAILGAGFGGPEPLVIREIPKPELRTAFVFCRVFRGQESDGRAASFGVAITARPTRRVSRRSAFIGSPVYQHLAGS